MAQVSRLAARIEALEKIDSPSRAFPVLVLSVGSLDGKPQPVLGYRVNRGNAEVTVLRERSESEEECKERAIAEGHRLPGSDTFPVQAIFLMALPIPGENTDRRNGKARPDKIMPEGRDRARQR